MNDLSKMSPSALAPCDAISRLVAPRIFASENATDHAALRASLFAELAPRTPYETALAENLVRYEWEMARILRFRDSAVLSRYRDLAMMALLTGDPMSESFSEPSDDQRALVRDLVSLDEKIRRVVETEFCECSDWEPADLLGLAYAFSSAARTLEDRIADFERRRRGLREDYARLQTARPRADIEDAEIHEGSDGH